MSHDNDNLQNLKGLSPSGPAPQALEQPQPKDQESNSVVNAILDLVPGDAVEIVSSATKAVGEVAGSALDAVASASETVGEVAGSALKAAGSAAEVVGEVAGSALKAIGSIFD